MTGTIGIGAILAGLSVAAGAFASHSLQGQLTESGARLFETASRYQMYHALALILVGIWQQQSSGASGQSLSPAWGGAIATFFGVGIVLFCGSLYLLALGQPRWLGAITPVGGVAFLLGWGSLAIAAWQKG